MIVFSALPAATCETPIILRDVSFVGPCEECLYAVVPKGQEYLSFNRRFGCLGKVRSLDCSLGRQLAWGGFLRAFRPNFRGFLMKLKAILCLRNSYL